MFMRKRRDGRPDGAVITQTVAKRHGPTCFVHQWNRKVDIPFNSDAKNLVIGDTNGFTDVFVHDTCAGANVPCLPSTVIVSMKLDGTQGNFNSAIPTISADGHFVTFVGGASNLVPITAPSNVFLARTSFFRDNGKTRLARLKRNCRFGRCCNQAIALIEGF